MGDPSSEQPLPERPVLLLTNDDGIYADGLTRLVDALAATSQYEIYVCAPDQERSAVGHAITTRDPVEVEPVAMHGATAYSTTGTPVDCVSIALATDVFPWKRPTLVISGINKGCNVGWNVIYSGTVAAAREAVILGVPAIAISYDWEQGESRVTDLKAAAEACLPVVQKAIAEAVSGSFPPGVLFNIDVPSRPASAKGVKATRQGSRRIIPAWKTAPKEPKRSIRGPVGGPMGAQLAQMGLAAAAAGLAKRGAKDKEKEEVDSVAPSAPTSTSLPKGKTIFISGIAGIEEGDDGDDVDGPALRNGWITVTALGLQAQVPPEITASVAALVNDL